MIFSSIILLNDITNRWKHTAINWKQNRRKSVSIIPYLLIPSCISHQTFTSCVSYSPTAWWMAGEIDDVPPPALREQNGFKTRLLLKCILFSLQICRIFPLNICISEIQIEYSLPLALLCTSNEVEKCTLMMESYLVLNRVNCF